MIADSLIGRWSGIRDTLPEAVRLIAVSKYTTDANVETLIDAGQIDFAEARPQNLRDRATAYPSANWHMIGPLQKNKAKYVGQFACMWHSLCDVDTAAAVAQHVTGRILPVLVQVNISFEPQKQGVTPDDLQGFLQQIAGVKNLEVVGLMGMAAATGDPRPAFQLLRQCRDNIISEYPKAEALCMGMSNDWRVAVEEGATMIRVGSEIFGG